MTATSNGAYQRIRYEFHNILFESECLARWYAACDILGIHCTLQERDNNQYLLFPDVKRRVYFADNESKYLGALLHNNATYIFGSPNQNRIVGEHGLCLIENNAFSIIDNQRFEFGSQDIFDIVFSGKNHYQAHFAFCYACDVTIKSCYIQEAIF